MKKYVLFFSLSLALSAQGMDEIKHRLNNIKEFVSKKWNKLTDPLNKIMYKEESSLPHNEYIARYFEKVTNNFPLYLAFLEYYDNELEKYKKEKSLEDKVKKTKKLLRQYSEYYEPRKFVYDYRIGDKPEHWEEYVCLRREAFMFDGTMQYFYRKEDSPCSFLQGNINCMNHQCSYTEYEFKDEKEKEDTCNRCIDKMQSFINARKQMMSKVTYRDWHAGRTIEQVVQLEREDR